VITLTKHLSSLVPVTLVLLCLSVAVTGVLGDPANEIVAKPGLTPTIDGVISSGEWVTASNVTFNQTTVYVMQDGVNLYVAFNVFDDVYSIGDECHIFFDVEHDKSSSLQPDDINLLVKRNGVLMERQGTPGGIWILAITSGWTVEVNSTSTFWQVEYNITYSKINVTAGSTKILGVEFESFNYNIPPVGAEYMWPYSNDPDFDKKPILWGNMTPNTYNWIPEFSNPLILVIALTATIPILLYIKAHKKLYKQFSSIHARAFPY